MKTELIQNATGFTIERGCKYCGCLEMNISEAKGPHGFGLECPGCKRHNGWLSKMHTMVIENARKVGFIDYIELKRQREQFKNLQYTASMEGDFPMVQTHKRKVEQLTEIIGDK